MSTVKIFISHSNTDEELARNLINLFRLALNLSHEDIRCTSVDGYKLTIGNNIEAQIRAEVHDVGVLLALITPFSLNSTYFLFELGARWGAEKPFFPLFARGIKPSSVNILIQQFHGANCESEGDLHQLVKDLANSLKINIQPTPSFLKEIKEIVETSVRLKNIDIFEDGDPDPSVQKKNQLEMWSEDMNLGDELSDFWNTANTYYINEFCEDGDPETLEGLIFAAGCPKDATTPNTELITWYSRNSHYLNHDQRRLWKFVTAIYPARAKNQTGDVWLYSSLKPEEEARAFHRARRRIATYFVKWVSTVGMKFIATNFGSRRGYIIFLTWLELALVQWTRQEGPGKQPLFKLAEYIDQNISGRHKS